MTTGRSCEDALTTLRHRRFRKLRASLRGGDGGISSGSFLCIGRRTPISISILLQFSTLGDESLRPLPAILNLCQTFCGGLTLREDFGRHVSFNFAL